MSNGPEKGQLGDAELKRLFQEMRALDKARAPSFAGMLDRIQDQGLEGEAIDRGSSPAKEQWGGTWQRDARTWHRLGWAGGLLAAAAVAAILLLPLGNGADARFEHLVREFSSDPAGGAWRSPTDGLLKLPGQAMLTTLPSIGGGDWPGGLGSGSGRNQH